MNEHLGIWFTVLLVTKNTTDKFDAAHEACGHMHDLATLHMEGAAFAHLCWHEAICIQLVVLQSS